MNEILLPHNLNQEEMARIEERELSRARLFVLLLGASAVGKTVIMEELESSKDFEFKYIKPLMTRSNRDGETSKISVSKEVFDELSARGEFVATNHLYGTDYGTPITPILDALYESQIPILDFPLHAVSNLERPEYDLLKFYIYPPSLGELGRRLSLDGRVSDSRRNSGLAEIAALSECGYRHSAIDYSIINARGSADYSARQIVNVVKKIPE